jgi:thiopeptide-type bacteriocin biosynthesis protein
VQVGLAVTPGRLAAVYRELLRTAEDLLGHAGAENFFFMHKPPGLRVRFETAGRCRSGLERELSARAARWRAAGLIADATPAVYEPEAHLFGGPVSMASVHRLFTADALAWLGYHVLACTAPVHPGPNWAFSLALLRSLFDGLGVVGWEDRDVWDRIRRDAGRRLAAPALAVDGFGRAADGVRQAWSNRTDLRAQLSPAVETLLDRFGLAARAEGHRWLAEYFTTRDAYVGPREAVAYYVVYHWNRGGLPAVRQAFLAESLARGAAATP